jgi:hypothetical protein
MKNIKSNKHMMQEDMMIIMDRIEDLERKIDELNKEIINEN